MVCFGTPERFFFSGDRKSRKEPKEGVTDAFVQRMKKNGGIEGDHVGHSKWGHFH